MKCFLLINCFLAYISNGFSQDSCSFICFALYDNKIIEQTSNFFLAKDEILIDLKKIIPEELKEEMPSNLDFIKNEESNLIDLDCNCFTDSIISYDSFNDMKTDFKYDSMDNKTDSIYTNFIFTVDTSSLKQWNELSNSMRFIKYQNSYHRQRPCLILFSNIFFINEQFCILVGIKKPNKLSDRIGFIYVFRKTNNEGWNFYNKYSFY